MNTTGAPDRVLAESDRWKDHYQQASRRRRSRGWRRRRDEAPPRRLRSDAIVLLVLGSLGLLAAVIAGVVSR
jgi:hypothetical protein